MRRRISLMLFGLLLAGCASGRQLGGEPAVAPKPPEATAPARLQLKQIAAGLTRPDYVTHAGDGSGRLFILEQPGRIRVMRDGKLLTAPFLDLTARINADGNEQGLLGLAFHPRYRQNGLFFVHYTGKSGETVIARYRASAQEPDRADAASGNVILTVPQPYTNHNGGAILFGPDGYLYIALGDGGSAGDPQNRAQNLESLLGKLLRVDVDAETYAVPPDNPLVGKAGKPEVWAYGLRNPWRISFDRATGDLYIADVGQNEIEEVNLQQAGSPGGQNYGWKVYEGSKTYGKGQAPGAVFPVAEYTHAAGGCSVTGGYVYRGRVIAGLAGIYFYADYCTGKIWGLNRESGRWVSKLLLDTDHNISSFGEDEAGELYVVDHGGSVFKLVSG